MEFLSGLRMWLRALFRQRDTDNELRREMQFHIQMEAERLVREGVPAAEALRQAKAAFGGMDRFAEDVRDERGTRFLQDVALDVHLAVRSIRLRPAFALVVALTLATGIGATTAVFSWANTLLLRGLPGVNNARDLFSVQFSPEPGRMTGLAYLNALDLAAGAPSVSSLAGAGWTSLQVSGDNITGADVNGAYVSGDYFGALGTRAELGRMLQVSELTLPNSPQVAVISYALWRRMFNSDTTVVQRRIMLNGNAFTVVGIAEREFRGTVTLNPIDIWIPLSAYASVKYDATDLMDRRVGILMELVGRYKPGANASIVQVDLRRVMANLVATYPELSIYSRYLAQVNPSVGMTSDYRGVVAKTLQLLLGIVALVMVIACANVANLLLFRSVKRRNEFAVRRALGASVSRLMRQHVTEGLMLSFLGGIGGLLVALVLVKAFAGQKLMFAPLFDQLKFDWRLLAFTVGICIANGVVFGIIPPLVALRRDTILNLKSGARTASGGSAHVRSVLTVVQLATSMCLVVGALLLTRTVSKLNAVDIGFDPTNVTTFHIDPSAQGYQSAQVDVLRRELLARVAVQPGITSVSAASSYPFAGGNFITDVKRVDYDGNDWQTSAPAFFVSPSYFTTLGMRVIAGRAFRPDEFQATGLDVMIISQQLSRRLFGDASAIGQHIIIRAGRNPLVQTIVGVVSDTRAQTLQAETPGEYMFSPRPDVIANRRIILLVKSRRDRRDLEKMIGGIVREFNASLPISRTETITETMAHGISTEKLFAQLIGLLAFLAAGLATVGLYSVISYSVVERTREIGVRMALGARESRIVELVAKQAGRLVVAGLVIGIAGAVMLSKIIESRLFGVSRLDPLVYAAALLLALVIGALASTLPARLAARVNPVDALRHE